MEKDRSKSKNAIQRETNWVVKFNRPVFLTFTGLGCFFVTPWFTFGPKPLTLAGG